MSKDRETPLLRAALASGINSKRELGNFMAQLEHESLGLQRLNESFRYTKGIHQIPVQSAHLKGPQALEDARQEALLGNPERLADLMYGGRMGNDTPGDGFKYRGRGYIHLTGKDGYRAAGEALGLDLVGHPDLAAQPEHATAIAVWYWNTHVHHVAPESVHGATRIINSGDNGLADRHARFAQWEKKLTPERMADLAKEASVLTAGLPSAGIANHATLGKPGAPTHRQAPARADAPPALTWLDDPAHPRHGMFEQAQALVRQLDAEHARPSDQRSDNLAAALVVAAAGKGMNRIDHVMLSTDASKVFVVQGALDSPHKQIASASTVTSLDKPMADSSRELDRLASPQAPEHARPPQITRSPLALHGSPNGGHGTAI